MVWDTSREDETLIATSGISDDTHREPVYKLHWVAATDSKKYNVGCLHEYFCLSGVLLTQNASQRSHIGVGLIRSARA